MANEMREGSGVIFKNDKKGNDKAPEYSGKALYKGEEIKIALWVKEGAKGKFFSVKIEGANTSAAPQPDAKKEDESDGPPF